MHWTKLNNMNVYFSVYSPKIQAPWNKKSKNSIEIERFIEKRSLCGWLENSVTLSSLCYLFFFSFFCRPYDFITVFWASCIIFLNTLYSLDSIEEFTNWDNIWDKVFPARKAVSPYVFIVGKTCCDWQPLHWGYQPRLISYLTDFILRRMLDFNHTQLRDSFCTGWKNLSLVSIFRMESPESQM